MPAIKIKYAAAFGLVFLTNAFASALAQPADTVDIPRPSLKALLTITNNMDPYQLDAGDTRIISLKETLEQAMAENLDIRIRNTDVTSRKWTLASSYGKFLPNINLSYRWQYLRGTPNLPLFGGAEPIHLNNPFIITGAGFNYYGYRGGKILFGALQNRNYLRAARYQQKSVLSDMLLESARNYYRLMLAEAVLNIRIKAVETSQSQLNLTEDLRDGGRATQLDVLQARTQLATDRQNLIDQQIDRREVAITLAELLNLDQGVDLVPSSRVVSMKRLVAEPFKPGLLIAKAIANRPELHQYEELRLAAKKSIVMATAPLQPSFNFFGNIYGIGETLSNSYKTVNNPITLAEAASFGGNGLSRRVSRQIGPLYTLGYQVNWNFEGLGSVDLANVISAKAQARQAQLEMVKQVNKVTSEVRKSCLRTLSAERKTEETMAKLNSSSEELRLAQLRFQHGVGLYLDVIKAQQDYTSAQIENAQALVDYDISQVQFLRDLGVISIANITSSRPLSLTQ